MIIAMKKKYLSVICMLMLTILNAQEIGVDVFATGLLNPVNLKFTNDNTLFVVERDGLIQIVDTNGNVGDTPFLDIDVNVTDAGGEQGLLGLAFHPNYDTNGFFYVNYINNVDDTVISRFTRLDATSADPNSEVELLYISQPYSNHNGGDMAFGPDGYLYISTGDGGAGGDPENRAQDLTTHLGKILRIDVNVTPQQIIDGTTYLIPSDNPFVSNPNALDEIWAYGLRNPWKFSFDKLTGDLWIGDVGQAEIEEINRVASTASGINYGWRCYEGDSFYDQSIGCSGPFTFPVSQYSHSGNGAFKCSITGGYRYRGTEQSTLAGLYFFADYCSNEIGFLEQNGGSWDMTFSEQFQGTNWSCFGEDTNGELYIAGISNGTIYKVIDSNLSVEIPSVYGVKMYPNPAENLVTFDIGSVSIALESIIISDVRGKILKSLSTFDANRIEISTTEFSSGIYMVELKGIDGSSETKKLIIK